jgi:hypothetical protein
MPRLYRVPYQGTLANSGGDADLLEALPGDDHPIALVGWIIGQTTELGDATEESLRLTVRHMAATVTSGSGGSAVTPVKTDSTDPAASFTAECNNATVATTSGTSTVAEEGAWNIRNTPYERWWPESVGGAFTPLMVRQGEGLFVRCESTPADDITITMTFFILEW